MGIEPNFRKSDIEKHFNKIRVKFEKATFIRLKVLGEECVKMSRESVGINPSAFPVNDTKAKNPKPLQQRVLRKSEIEKGIIQAPVFGDYLDQTANLRNSIGYFISKDGVIISSVGDDKAAELAQKVISEFTNGFALVVTAGMEYAAAVEAKGYNVISSSMLYAESQIPNIKRKIEEALKK